MNWQYLVLTLFLILGVQAQSFADIEFDQAYSNIIENFESAQDIEDQFLEHEKVYAHTLSYGEYLANLIQSNKPLTGEHLNRIHRGLALFLQVTDELYREVVMVNDDLVRLGHEIELMERFKSVRDAFYEETMLRRIVKDQAQFEDYGLRNLAVLTNQFFNKGNLKRIQRELEDLDQAELSGKGFEKLKQTQTFEEFNNGTSVRKFFKVKKNLGDRVSAFIAKITGGLSAGFGALVGSIEWREGRLYQNPEFKQTILETLRPLDLVFEKKTFKLTDKTIPGHWGHVGLWLGTKEQLIDLGIWDSVELAPFREQIEAGNSIFEMRRWGMQFDSIENFLNLDEIAITRVSNILERSQQDLKQTYLDLHAQMNKRYDFSFDSMATTKVTCTEIIMLSYGAINWPMDRVLGRLALTPNNMAELALYNQSPVEFVAYFQGNKNKEVKALNASDFAGTLGYKQSKKNGLFEKVKRVCRRVRERINGKIRSKRVCHDELTLRTYQKPQLQ